MQLAAINGKASGCTVTVQLCTIALVRTRFSMFRSAVQPGGLSASDCGEPSRGMRGRPLSGEGEGSFQTVLGMIAPV